MADPRQLTLFAEGSLEGEGPANPSVSPGSEEARKMTATSGQKCSALLTNSDPLGCLARTLLESSIWRSMTFFLTWKASVTPRKRLLFRLVPSAPRTGESGCSSWATPSAADSVGSHGGGQGRSLRTDIYNLKHGMWPTPDVPNGGRGIPKDAVIRGSTIYTSDGRKIQIGLQNAVRMWPTPVAMDGRRGSSTYMRGKPTLLGAATWPTPNARDHKGQGHLNRDRPIGDDDLPTRVARSWPTPRASDGEKGGPNQLDSKGVYALPGAVAHAWPTPTQSDGMGGPGSSGRDGGLNLRTAVSGTLNPEFVEALMGLPIGWTECDGPPFRGLSMTGNLSERQ